MDARSVLPANTVLDGTYRIVRVVGSGGFGITYEAEDLNLGTTVALKEYYPDEFGDRDARMSVRAKSERHKQTFEWGRSNFLKEARTLARFEHPSIVRVTRVFEANSTAYMVMSFERGQSFEAWLTGLGRPPTQEELDTIVAPLLNALEKMHAADFLHRDIAPDNIIVRADGTPVLLDFGAARRAVAEMTRMMTGIVKAGYSPHEQYSSNNRLQGPWSDIYALGGTLYRAVTGSPPEEATLRVDDDRMAPAALAAKGRYRPEFLAAIDDCLKVRAASRPRSVAQLRPMLLGHGQAQPARSAHGAAPDAARTRHSTSAVVPASSASRWIVVAAVISLLGGGLFGAYQFTAWQPGAPSRTDGQRQTEADLARARENRELEKRLDEERIAAEDAARRAAETGSEEERAQAERQRIASRDDAKPKAPSEPPRNAQPSTRQGRLLKLPVTLRAPPNEAQRVWLGVNTETLDSSLALSLGLPNASGIFILNPVAGGPADQAGIRVGDVLLRIDGATIANPKDLRQQLARASGSQTLVEVWRVAADERDLLQLLRELADAGNAHAMYLLGRMYAGGIATVRDDAEAARWYRKGADAGDVNATAGLAITLLDGRGVAADQPEGLRLLRTAAAKDNIAAMHRLGLVLAEGRITAKDPLEAVRLLTKAAEAGYVPSMFELGRAYYNGTGVQADPSKAALWYKQAADLGNSGAMANLGWLYEHGKGVELDVAKAVALYSRSVELNNSGAMVNLGLLHQQGKGVAADIPKAAALFKRAADLNNAAGMVNLGLLQAQGKGVEKNEVAAVTLYRKAVGLGNPSAMNNLAWMVQSGLGGTHKDPEEAAGLILQALDRRNEFAQKQLTQNSNTWTKEFRQAVQKRLRDAGFYKGQIDGEFRDSTIAAVNAYMNRVR